MIDRVETPPPGYQILRTPPALAPIIKPGDDPIVEYPIGLEPLDVRYIDGRQWLLLSAFMFASKRIERLITVPAGFVTDFASIPKPLWNLLPPTGSYGKAAVLHDYLYRTKGACSRGDADGVLLEAMEALGVGWWTRSIIYSGVRVGGHWSYKGGL